MKRKLGGGLFMLLFSLPFAGVGAGAAYVLFQNVADSYRAQDWVVAKASVKSGQLVSSRGSKGGTTYRAEGTYQYVIDGKTYVGDRLGVDRLGGSDNLGDWHENMAAYLEEARASGKPITVYVNPDKPDEAVVDRGLRWAWILFVGVFAVMFGGAGVGIFAGGIYAARGPAREKKKREQRKAARAAVAATPASARDGIKSDGAGGAFGLWIFAIIWNLISVPVALIAVPELIENGEYWGLFVLLFPLIGALILWGAIQSTISILRRGSATLVLEPASPAIGVAFNGVMRFSRSVPAGERYSVELSCLRHQLARSRNNAGARPVDVWSKTIEARAVRGADGDTKLAFRHQAPLSQLPTTTDEEADERYAWRIEIERVEPKQGTAFGFDIEMASAPKSARDSFAEPESLHPDSPPFAASTASAASFASTANTASAVNSAMEAELVKLFGADKVAKMPEATREIMYKLTPQQRAVSAQVQRWLPRIVKIVIAIVLLQIVAGIVVSIVTAFHS